MEKLAFDFEVFINTDNYIVIQQYADRDEPVFICFHPDQAELLIKWVCEVVQESRGK